MAKLIKRKYKSGKFVWAITYYDGPNQKLKTIGATDKRTAEKAFAKFTNTLLNSKFGIAEVEKITMSAFKERYFRSINLEKSENTISREKRILRQFIDFTGNVHLDQISTEHVIEFRLKRHSDGLNATTINIEFRHLKAVFNWAVRSNLIESSPFNGIKQIKTIESELPKYFSINEIEDIRKGFYGNKYQHLVDFYLLTGCRLNEALNLKWEDISNVEKTVIFKSTNTKSGKNRIIPFEKDKPLEELLERIPRKSDIYVFPSNEGDRKLQAENVSRRISNMLTKLGFNWASCHTFRHTYISHLVLKGVPLNVVKEIVGHSSIQTTLRYAHLADKNKSEFIAFRPY
jgi:site-specific recombinase XerD